MVDFSPKISFTLLDILMKFREHLSLVIKFPESKMVKFGRNTAVSFYISNEKINELPVDFVKHIYMHIYISVNM